MKILVYGAGVLGSYLAHELIVGKQNVTILARGRRNQEIKENGLVIEHICQKKRTVDKLPVIDTLLPNHTFDIIFVVMQKSQIDSILPALAENTYNKTIVFVGNNCMADKTHRTMQRLTKGKTNVLFGFLGCGGHRSNGVVYNWHTNTCEITVGTVTADYPMDQSIAQIFDLTNLKLDLRTDMNSWLKYHGALIAPLCIAIQHEGGANNLYRSKALYLSIEALKKAIAMFDNNRFKKDSPHDMKLLQWPTKLLQFGLAIFLPTKTGHFVAIDHALAAVEEIELLTKELQTCSEEYQYPLPCLEELVHL